MKISIYAKTDVGCGRENNEDAFAFCPNLSSPQWNLNHTKGYIPLGPQGTLIIVADGMGGANAGEVASAIAIETVKKAFSGEQLVKAAASEEAARQLLIKAIQDADEAINLKMFDNPETAGMGTTIVVCWLTAQKAFVAWCGDSRCYRYNDADGLLPLTKDHSYVQELIDRGELTVEEAFQHPDNNIITRGLGDFDTQVQPDIAVSPIKPGDMFMLCSDGLCGYCTNEQIRDILADSKGNTEKCSEDLLRKALEVPGDDNICIVVASLLDDNAQEPSSSKFRQFMSKLFG